MLIYYKKQLKLSLFLSLIIIIFHYSRVSARENENYKLHDLSCLKATKSIKLDQSNEPIYPSLDNVIPPSPEASLLYRYIQTPVNHYTGVPSIQVPLFSILDGNLELPLSLSYHAGGNKIEDIASFVGLAWSLNAGGSVSRIVRGLPDDQPQSGFLSFIKEEGITQEYLFSTDPNRWATLSRIAEGCVDSEPDEFFFSVNGITGKFAFDWDGKLIVSSSSKINVKPIFQDEIDTNPIIGWIITLGDGARYRFLEIDNTTILNYTPYWGTKRK